MNLQPGNVALARVFRVVNGGTPTAAPEHWDGPIPWATPMDLAPVDGGVVGHTSRTLTPAGLRQGSATVPEGSILVSTRAPIGYVATVDTATAFNQGCRGLVPRDRVDSRYFVYQLQARRPILEARGQGSTFVELSSTALAALRLCQPELDEQRRIADFLDAETARIDALIAKKRRMRDLITERSAALLDAALETLNVRAVPLRRVIRRIEQGWSPQCEAREPDDGEWGVLRVGCVNGGIYRPHDAKALPADVAPRAQHLVRNGDLLVSRANTRELVGSAAIAEDVRPRTLLCDKLFRLRLDEHRAVPEFVSLWLQTGAARSQFELEATGASNSMQNIAQDTLRDVAMPLPSREEQARIALTFQEQRRRISSLLAANDRQIERLGERRQALITAAVTGQLPVAV